MSKSLMTTDEFYRHASAMMEQNTMMIAERTYHRLRMVETEIDSIREAIYQGRVEGDVDLSHVLMTADVLDLVFKLVRGL